MKKSDPGQQELQAVGPQASQGEAAADPGLLPSSSIRILTEEAPLHSANIKVVGVGGGGGNAIARMMKTGLTGVEFVAANTDLQALENSVATIKIQLGTNLTRGLGAGANPEIGRQGALEDADAIVEALEGADMVFVTGGLGGGTATGAAPVIARLANELGALTVAVMTKPFTFEGRRRMQQADLGLKELQESVDTLIAVPNDRLLATVSADTPIVEAFQVADQILQQGVHGIADLILVPGLINLDFADVRTVMSGMGMAIMGTARRDGADRAAEAATAAINSPLLEETSIEGARGVLISISGGPDLTLHEINEASTIISEAADEDANILFGAVVETALEGSLQITVIATGFEPYDPIHQVVLPAQEQIEGSQSATETSFYRPGTDDADPDGGLVNPSLDLDEEDLDVPAFLRNRPATTPEDEES